MKKLLTTLLVFLLAASAVYAQEIGKVGGVAWDSIGKAEGVAQASIGTVEGLAAPVGGGGDFDATAYTGNILWLDPADETTITSVATLVSQIDDKSTVGTNHGVQGTGSYQLKTGTRTVNGLNVLESVATDVLELPAGLLRNYGGVTVHIVYNQDYAASFEGLFCYRNNADSGYVLAYFNGSSTENPARRRIDGPGANAAEGSGLGTYVPGTTEVLTLVIDMANDTMKVYVNNTEVLSNTSTGFTPTVTEDLDAAVHRLGTRSADAGPFDGVYGDIVVYDHVQTSGDRGDVVSGLMTKWGL